MNNVLTENMISEEDNFIGSEFAIVQFEDGLEIIRAEWGTYNRKGEILASAFPSGDRNFVIKCLLTENCKTDETWWDENQQPYKVVKLLKYASK